MKERLRDTGISCLHPEECSAFLNMLGAKTIVIGGRICARDKDVSKACWLAEDYGYSVFRFEVVKED